MNLSQEQQLIEQAKTDASAFGLLFDAYYEPIYGYCLKRLGTVEVAQDITSETFYKALQKIHRFTWRGISISAWFYQIANNEMRMYFRRNRHFTISLDVLYDQTGYEPISAHDLLAETIAAQEMIDRKSHFLLAQRHLAALPVKYQEVITLRYMENKKHSEISQILCKKEGTVKSLLSRGIALLRKRLEVDQMQPIPGLGITPCEGILLSIKPEGSDEG